jgi:hypothetical protein
MIKENPKYKKHTFYNNMKVKEKNYQSINPIMHGLFYVEGEYPFGELSLIRYNWNKIHSLNDEKEPRVMASVQDSKIFDIPDEDYKKTLIFENKRERGLIVMQLNTKIHYHEIDISANKDEYENPGIIKRAKSMLERELGFGCKLEDRENILSNLTNKLGLESN